MPNNYTIQDVKPSNYSIEVTTAVFQQSTMTYSQAGIPYSAVGTPYGGADRVQGNRPNNSSVNPNI